MAAEPATVAAWFRPLLLVAAAVCGWVSGDEAVREERDRVEWKKRGNRKVCGVSGGKKKKREK